MRSAREHAAFAVAGALFLTAGCATREAVRPAFDPALSSRDEALVQALAHFAQGLVFEWQEPPDGDAALQAYRLAARLDPHEEELRHLAARLLLDREAPEQALALLEEAVLDLPSSPGIRNALARVALVSGRFDLAAREFLACAGLSESSADRHEPLNLATYAFFSAGQDAEALAVLGRIAGLPHQEPFPGASATPGTDPSYRTRAIQFALELAELRLDDAARAEQARAYAEWSESQVRSDAERADLWQRFGVAAMRRRQIDLAVMAFWKSADFDPLRTDAVIAALALEAGTARERVSLEKLREALDQCPGNVALQIAVARLLIEAKRHEEALPHVDAAAALWSRDDLSRRKPPEFWLLHGSALERAGRLLESEGVFRRALEEHPGYAPIQNYLAYMLAEQSRELEHAETLVRQALRQDPENGAYLDTLGWIYFRMGRHPEALVWLLLAAGGEIRDAVIFDHVGDVLLALGRDQEAIAYWSMSFHLDPENQDVAVKLSERGVELDPLRPPPTPPAVEEATEGAEEEAGADGGGRESLPWDPGLRTKAGLQYAGDVSKDARTLLT